MIEHPYAAFLARVEKPARYLGGEWGSARPPAGAELRVALSYPDLYELGMSHIGLSVLYEIAAGLPAVGVERVFMPAADLEAALRSRGLPLVSLETARPLGSFDVVGFTLQHELTYTNLLAMLDLGRVPVRAADRTDADPFVIVGGPLAVHCEPLAPFVDAVVIGDGEEALPAVLDAVLRGKRERLGRAATLAALHALSFAHVPALLEREPDAVSGRIAAIGERGFAARRAVVADLGAQPAGNGPVPAVEAVFDRYSLEIARGCTAGCRFCQAGFLYRPVRERDLAETRAAVERAVGCLGFDEVSLAALSTADHSAIAPIVAALGAEYTAKRVSFSVPSLRAYGLPDDVVEVLSRLRGTGVTLAPEAGTQRLRDAINKNVTEADLMAAASRFFGFGLTKIKLYFMIGLPGETDDDLRAMADLACRLRDFGRRRLRGRSPAITISVSTFVPKPFTPFEREPMIRRAEVERRQAIVEAEAARHRIPVRLHDARLSLLEGVLCRGDATLAPMLEEAMRLGARFDGWSERFREDIWGPLLEGRGAARFLDAIPPGARLPWDHVDVGIDPAFLEQELARARAAAPTPPCGRFAQPDGSARVVCHGCGAACDPDGLPLRAEHAAPGADPGAGPPAPQSGKPRPRAAGLGDRAGTGAERLRLHLAKWGRAVFAGHLDTMQEVMRCLRRAGLQVAYTQGFHPKPRLVSCPPLPLGMAALADPMDVFIVEPPPPDEALDRLSRAVPDGLAFVAAERVEAGEKSLSRRIRAAEYVAFVAGDAGAMAAEAEKLLAAPSWIVARERKGKSETCDIRPFVLGAALSPVQAADVRLPPATGRIAVEISLLLPGSGGARLSDVIAALNPAGALGAWAVRTRVILG